MSWNLFSESKPFEGSFIYYNFNTHRCSFGKLITYYTHDDSENSDGLGMDVYKDILSSKVIDKSDIYAWASLNWDELFQILPKFEVLSEEENKEYQDEIIGEPETYTVPPFNIDKWLEQRKHCFKEGKDFCKYMDNVKNQK